LIGLLFFTPLVASALLQRPGGGPGGGGGGGGRRLSPASLDLDTCGCPTTFESPFCEKETSWSLTKTTQTGPITPTLLLVDNDGDGQIDEELCDGIDNDGDGLIDEDVPEYANPTAEPYSFDVTVIEGPTTETLTAVGTVRISNSGAQTPTLANVAVLLEDYTPGTGDAPGPSGNNWTILGVTAENEHPACGNQAVTCDGVFQQTAGSSLVLYTVGGDPDNENDVIALTSGVTIPPAVDDDGDGMSGEDPALATTIAAGSNCWGIFDNDGDGLLDEDPGFGNEVGIDNDGDGSIDEDPIDGIDNDLDGKIDEDDPDDDGDGLVDEDGPDDDRDGLIDEDDNCADIVAFNFQATFNVAGLGISGPGDGIVPSADDLRIDLLVTFKGGGKRGGTCKLDVDCDGTIEDGKGGTADEGEGHVRTVQQRLQFDPPPCPWLCQTVTLTDPGAVSSDPTCVTVDSSNALNTTVAATELDGTATPFSVSGTVSCASGTTDCVATISNTATLACDDGSALVTGSPASATFQVSCSDLTPCSPPEPPPGPNPGDFCSQTQGGWGSDTCRGNNTACLRDNYFSTLFPSGLVVGDPDGPDADTSWAILLTSSAGVAELLPTGGTPAALTGDLVDPQLTAAGVFAGQLIAATLNVTYDAAGIGKCTLLGSCSFPHPPGTLGSLVYGSCVAPALQGLDVNTVIALSNVAISGGGTPAGVTISDLSDALAALNEEFVDCNVVATGCLTLP
jgi:hypothetical protein